MAEKRMFAKSIVLSDAFLDMPLSARCLYFTLGMLADDEGFVGNPKSVMRQCGASVDDMNVLISKRYVLCFDSGVIVIKHWRINNFLRNDRTHQTTYLEEKSTLTVDKKGAYTELKVNVGIPSDNQVTTTCQPTDNQVVGKRYTEIRLDKNRLDKNNNNILSEKNTDNGESKEIIAYLNTVLGTRYTTKNKSIMSMINARLAEGHTVDDFKTVIDKKNKQWRNDPKMSKYLRPETLFCAHHFDSYLNEKVVEEPAQPAKPNQTNKFGKGMIQAENSPLKLAKEILRDEDF